MASTDKNSTNNTQPDQFAMQGKLLEIARQLSSNIQLENVLSDIAKQAHDLLNAHGSAIYNLSEDGRKLIPAVAIEDGYEEEILADVLDVENSLTGQAILTGQSKIFNDPYSQSYAHHINGTPVNSDERVLVSPLIVEGKEIGAICLSRIGDSFTQDDLTLLETFAVYASTALKNAGVYQSLVQEINNREAAEDALQKSEIFLRQIIDNTPNSIYVKDKEGTYLLVNKNMAEMHNMSPSEMIGKTDISISRRWLDTDDRIQAFRSAENEIITSGKHKYIPEEEYIFDDGRRRWFQTTKIPIKFPDNLDCIMTVAVDITDRRMIEKALRTSEENYRLMIENQTDLVVKVDIDGRFLFVSPSYCDVFGKSEQELLGKRFMPLVHDDDKESTAKAMEALYKPPHTAYMEQRAMTKKGWKWLAWQDTAILNEVGEVIEIIGVGRDIDDRKRVNEDLRRSEEKFRSVVTNSDAIIFILDAKGKFLLSEGKTLKVLGLKPGQVVGLSAQEFYKDFPPVVESINNALQGETVNVVVEVQDVIFDVFFNPTVDDSGQVTSVIGVATNITERIRLEEQLRHAQKLESITRLTGGIAHDFNNILGSIFGAVDMLLLNIPKDHPGRHYADIVIDKSQKAADLVKQMLAYSRQQQMNPVPMDINKAIEDLSIMLERVIEERIKLTLELADDINNINGDRTAIDQIMMNLCINSINAMPDGGALLVKTENISVKQENQQKWPELVAGEYIRLTVTDTGQGIDPQHLDKIYEPFFTTREVGAGSGLGLSMAYGLVKQQAGNIYCTSEVGKGTTFEIFFPVSEATPEEHEEDIPLSEVERGSGKILLAEDEEELAEVLRMMLTQLGYRVQVTFNGREAYDLYKQNTEQFDLVISDIIMPEMGGQELYQKIMAINPATKFLFTSGYASQGFYKKYELNPDMKILNKPFRLREVSTVLKEILA